MSKILVTGANGQLGSELQKIAKGYTDLEFVFSDVDTLDITDLPSLEKFCKGASFNYIINCAAYTAVDKAETDRELAFKINRDAVRNLAKVASMNNSVFIHVSTDYVFDGISCQPYTEEHPINPQSVYGTSKAEGEAESAAYSQSLIIRTSWLYSSFGNNFVKTMLKLGAERPELRVIFDQVGTPTYAGDLAECIISIVRFSQNNGVKPGVYHFSNEGVCSWYDFASEIISSLNNSCKVSPIESKDYPTPVKRPFYSVLNKGKIKATFNVEIPHWKTSLYKCLNELKNK